MSGDAYFDLNLPSAGRLYDVGAIKVRRLTAGDEKFLQDISALDFDVRFNQLLKNGVLQGIEPEKLSMGDRFYIVIWLARNSLNKDVLVSDVCEHCLAKLSVTVDLGSLEVITLPDSFVEPIKVMLGGKLVDVRLLRVKDLLESFRRQQQDRDDVELFKFAQTITSMDVLSALEFVKTLSLTDFGRLKAVQVKFNHGVKLETTVKCQKCGGEGVVPVPFRFENLVPDVNALAGNLEFGV